MYRGPPPPGNPQGPGYPMSQPFPGGGAPHQGPGPMRPIPGPQAHLAFGGPGRPPPPQGPPGPDRAFIAQPQPGAMPPLPFGRPPQQSPGYFQGRPGLDYGPPRLEGPGFMPLQGDMGPMQGPPRPGWGGQPTTANVGPGQMQPPLPPPRGASPWQPQGQAGPGLPAGSNQPQGQQIRIAERVGHMVMPGGQALQHQQFQPSGSGPQTQGLPQQYLSPYGQPQPQLQGFEPSSSGQARPSTWSDPSPTPSSTQGFPHPVMLTQQVLASNQTQLPHQQGPMFDQSQRQPQSAEGQQGSAENEQSQPPATLSAAAIVDKPTEAWTAHKTGDGTVYYYNTLTGVSTYEKPKGFKGEPEKVTAQPVPVSWEKLGASDWALVSTNDGKKYYYNTKTQATSWQVPPEVLALRTKDTDKTDTEKKVKKEDFERLSLPSIDAPVREAKQTETGSFGFAALKLVKKKLADTNDGKVESEPEGETVGITVATEGDPASPGEEEDEAKQAEEDSREAEEARLKEERAAQFREMLKEKGVAPFSKWDRELPKIIFDPRFKAVPGHSERRSLFEHYVKTRAEEERKERRAAQKAAVEKFKALLEEKAEEIDHETTLEGFAEQFGEDPRFQALEQRERAILLNERLAPLKKAHEEALKLAAELAAAAFSVLLEEKAELVTATSRWSKVKDSLREDKRYSAVSREKREILFNAHVGKLKAAEEKEKAKRAEEDKLRAREKEARKRKEREEEELERIRTKAKRKDAVSSFQTLLLERVKEADASWSDWRTKLEKDAEGRGVASDLEAGDKEKLFRDHVEQLKDRAVRDYKALLVETITPAVVAKEEKRGRRMLTSFTDAKSLLKDDPRYEKVPRSERETVYRRFAEDLRRGIDTGSKDKEAKTEKDGGKSTEKANGVEDAKHQVKGTEKEKACHKEAEGRGSKRDRDEDDKKPRRNDRGRSRSPDKKRNRSKERERSRERGRQPGNGQGRGRSPERGRSGDRHRSRSRHGHRSGRR